MADVRPFRGIRYNPAKVAILSDVITQPYDKITPGMQQAYHARHDHSFVRLILPASQDPYNDSDRTCKSWLESAVLIRDKEPAFYVLHQEFETAGRRKLRRGFIGTIRVDEFNLGTVLPHERTLSKPKADRLNLLRSTCKDYEQIFMLYSDPSGTVDQALEPSGGPLLEAMDEYGVRARVWAVAEPTKIAAVRQALRDKTMLIADGHHRYETALDYRLEQERAGSVPQDAALRFKTAAFVNINDPGLVILPTHRLLQRLPPVNWDESWHRIRRHFTVRPVEDTALGREVAESFGSGDHVFGLHAGKDRSWVLKLVDRSAMARAMKERSDDYRSLDVAILHTLIIDGAFGVPAEMVEEHVAYERDAAVAIAKVDSAQYQVALIINPTRAEQVSRVAARGERMPQKSTDFYPKLVSGLVFFDVAKSERV